MRLLAILLVAASLSCGCAANSGAAETSDAPDQADAAQAAVAGDSAAVSAGDLYTYKATITDVYDGDTVTADIDLGFHVWIHGEKLRLSRINAPEVRGDERPQGLITRDWLREKILGKEVLIKTIKSKSTGYDEKGKYGRYLAEIYLDGVNINDKLVINGLAVYKDY